MNRSCFALAALLGLSLLSVNAARGQLLADELETIGAQPKTFSQLLEMIGDCAHGVANRYDELDQAAKTEQTADIDAGDSTPDEIADAATATEQSGVEESAAQETEIQEEVAQEAAVQEEVAQEAGNQKSGDDYLADENLTAEDAVNLAFDRAIAPPVRAIAPPVVNSSVDDADYQDEVAAPASPIADEVSDSEADWADQPAPAPAAVEVATPVDSADPYDGELAETYQAAETQAAETQATETSADDVVAAETGRFDRQALLSVAELLDRLGAALQTASCELTALAALDTDSINR
jgi:hypothetical protein